MVASRIRDHQTLVGAWVRDHVLQDPVGPVFPVEDRAAPTGTYQLGADRAWTDLLGEQLDCTDWG